LKAATLKEVALRYALSWRAAIHQGGDRFTFPLIDKLQRTWCDTTGARLSLQIQVPDSKRETPHLPHVKFHLLDGPALKRVIRCRTNATSVC